MTHGYYIGIFVIQRIRFAQQPGEEAAKHDSGERKQRPCSFRADRKLVLVTGPEAGRSLRAVIQSISKLHTVHIYFRTSFHGVFAPDSCSRRGGQKDPGVIGEPLRSKV